MTTRRFRHLLSAALVLLAWAVGVVAPMAEARERAPSSALELVHVEAQGDNPAHATHHHDCTWCSVLRLVPEQPTRREVVSFRTASVTPAAVIVRPSLALLGESAPARAPPTA